MPEDSPNDLNNGHFGVPAYDLKRSQWNFARTQHGSEIRQLGPWKVVIPPAIHYPSPRAVPPLRNIPHAIKNLVRDHPELVPAASHVAEVEAVSAAATAALSAHDTTNGHLLSFGTILPAKQAYSSTRKVVALPAGEGGNILRLQMLARERHGWAAEEHKQSISYIEGLSLKGDCGYWNEDAAAIQQICFAQSEDAGSFLAVRLPQRIALFRPVYYPRRVAAGVSRWYNIPPSIFELRPFHSVWISETGGPAHADVAFNPHYQRQFAIVDQDSAWSVWDIEGTRRNYTVTHAASGSMKNNDDEMDSDAQAERVKSWKQDGWARVMWVGDANTILVCNRRQVDLVSLKEPVRALKMPQVIDWSSTKQPSKDWIVDIKRHPTNEKQFFVLTSVRLYLYSVNSWGEDLGTTSRSEDADVVLSWTHFRGTEDVTLQLHVKKLLDDETIVLVYSRLNALITAYRLVEQMSAAVPCRSFGPTTLRLATLDGSNRSMAIHDFDVSQLYFKGSRTGVRGTGHEYEDQGVQFYQLSAMFDDLSVAQTILSTLGSDAKERSLEDIKATTWSKLTRAPVQTLFSNDTVSGDEDDFVEPDGLITAPDPRMKFPNRQPQSVSRGILVLQKNIVNFSRLYEALASNLPLASDDAKASTEVLEMSALVEELRWRLGREENVTSFTLGTLQEYAEAVVIVDDVDEASEQLQQLTLGRDHASHLELRTTASDLVLGFGAHEPGSNPSLSSVYDVILQSWIAPLPRSIPARIRQSKERMARRIAGGVVLAATRVRQAEDRDTPISTQPKPSQDSAVALLSSLPQWLSQPGSSQSNNANAFNNVPSSTPTPFDPLARLSNHLHIASTEAPEIAPSINQVIKHWELGTDPSAYDWEACEREFEEELELKEEGSQKKREKARRKKEKQAKRQKKENELFTEKVKNVVWESQPRVMRSSPGPAITMSSQPRTQSQSQLLGGLLGVQSQVEPGRHGGRPDKKKKIKSRMSGF